MILRPALVFIGSLLFLAACQEQVAEPKIAARAYEHVLTVDELSEIIPNEISAEDSLRLAESFINNWLRENVVLHHAEMNLVDEKKDFTRQLEDYRKSLLIYAFESELIEQKMDTVISDEEIEAYYRSNQDNFQLKDYIVQVRFCVLDNQTPKLNKFRKLFYSTDTLDVPKLEEFCIESGARFFLQEDQWLYLDDLLKEVPIQIFNRESFLKKNKNIEFEKENSLFFLIIKDFKLKDSVSPLSLEYENIKSILLNKRKLELLSSMRNDLFNDALRNKAVEINHQP